MCPHVTVRFRSINLSIQLNQQVACWYIYCFSVAIRRGVPFGHFLLYLIIVSFINAVFLGKEDLKKNICLIIITNTEKEMVGEK